MQEAIKLVETVTVDAICADYYIRDGTGMELLQTLRQQEIKTSFMLMSANDDYCLADRVQRWDASFCCKTAWDFLDRITRLANKI